MATYVSLVNWTEQGVSDFKDTTKRAEQARETARNMGGEMLDIYWTIGPYDIVVVSRFPDDETATAYLLALSSQGNVRTTSMRAFEASEMQGILGKAG
jgi:uncharacterized protein with GYD domain